MSCSSVGLNYSSFEWTTNWQNRSFQAQFHDQLISQMPFLATLGDVFPTCVVSCGLIVLLECKMSYWEV